MTTQESTQLRYLFERAYIPATAYALLIGQHPEATPIALRQVFLEVAEDLLSLEHPMWIFRQLDTVVPKVVLMEGRIPVNATIPRPHQQVGSLPIGRRHPPQIRSSRPFKPVEPIGPGAASLPAEENLILQPLIHDSDTDSHSQELRGKILAWLSHLKLDAKLAAVLQLWLCRVGVEETDIPQLIAEHLLQDETYINQLLDSQQKLWEELFAKDGCTIDEILPLWFDCFGYDEGELQKDVLKKSENKRKRGLLGSFFAGLFVG